MASNNNNLRQRKNNNKNSNQYMVQPTDGFMQQPMPMQPGMMMNPYYQPQMIMHMPGQMMPMQPGMMMNPYYQPQMMMPMPAQMMPMQQGMMPMPPQAMQPRMSNHLQLLPAAIPLQQQQPIIKVINNGYNIEDSITVTEKNNQEDEEEKDNQENDNLEARDGAVGSISEIEDDEDPDVVHIPPPSTTKQNNNRVKDIPQSFPKVKQQQQQQQQVQEQVKQQIQPQPQPQVKNAQADNLADMLDNVLDAGIGEPNPIREHYAQFGQENDNSNVILSVKPLDKTKAHYNKASHPDEIYKATMFNGDEHNYNARDLSNETLETAKVVNTFNANQKNPATGGKAFIYARCSTANDISIDTQLKAGLQYASNHNMELLPFGYQFDNGISGRNMNNLNYELGFWHPQIPDGSHIIIYSVDRLSRHLIKGLQFLEEMAARNISVHFIMSELVYTRDISSANKARIQQELQTAEQYSNMLSERIRKTQERLRAEGHILGGRAKYGFKNVKVNGIRKRIVDIQEQQNIRQIQVRYQDYIQNYDNHFELKGARRTNAALFRTLIRWCNRNGLHNRNGEPYTKQQIERIVNLQPIDNAMLA